MEVLVKLHSVLRRYATARDYRRPFAVTVAEGAALGDVLTLLGLPEDQEYLIFVGTERRDRDRTVSDGDVVTILPPIVGG